MPLFSAVTLMPPFRAVAAAFATPRRLFSPPEFLLSADSAAGLIALLFLGSKIVFAAVSPFR
jgi:hypothetical protein